MRKSLEDALTILSFAQEFIRCAAQGTLDMVDPKQTVGKYGAARNLSFAFNHRWTRMNTNGPIL